MTSARFLTKFNGILGFQNPIDFSLEEGNHVDILEKFVDRIKGEQNNTITKNELRALFENNYEEVGENTQAIEEQGGLQDNSINERVLNAAAEEGSIVL